MHSRASLTAALGCVALVTTACASWWAIARLRETPSDANRIEIRIGRVSQTVRHSFGTVYAAGRPWLKSELRLSNRLPFSARVELATRTSCCFAVTPATAVLRPDESASLSVYWRPKDNGRQEVHLARFSVLRATATTCEPISELRLELQARLMPPVVAECLSGGTSTVRPGQAIVGRVFLSVWTPHPRWRLWGRQTLCVTISSSNEAVEVPANAMLRCSGRSPGVLRFSGAVSYRVRGTPVVRPELGSAILRVRTPQGGEGRVRVFWRTAPWIEADPPLLRVNSREAVARVHLRSVDGTPLRVLSVRGEKIVVAATNNRIKPSLDQVLALRLLGVSRPGFVRIATTHPQQPEISLSVLPALNGLVADGAAP